MSKKVYAVRKGTVPGIYASWPECEVQVRGVPGAEYKSFKSEAEAHVWLGESSERGTSDPPPPPTAQPQAPIHTAATAVKPPDDLPPWDLPSEDTATSAAPAPAPPPPAPEPAPAPPAASGTDYRQQLDEKAAAFLAYLQEQDVRAYAASGGSQYHERIGIEGGGWVDLYHTRKKPYNLISGRFEDPALRDQVIGLWQAFHLGSAVQDPAPERTPWDSVEHYYCLLAPYAALRFDFVALARALRNAAPEAPDPDAVRYDFAQIETAYRHLRPQTA